MVIKMSFIIKQVLSIPKRVGTNVSPFAMLKDVSYDKTSAIRALVKMERSSIGKCSSIGTLSAAYDCEIGKFVSIARECYLGGAVHPLDRVSTSGCFYLKSNYTGVCYYEDAFEWKKHSVIGNDVWIGYRSVVLAGRTISDGAVIGAGSVVTKDVGPYEIWAGNPARLIRKRFDEETIKALIEIKWWDWEDNLLKSAGEKFVNVEDFVKAYSIRCNN